MLNVKTMLRLNTIGRACLLIMLSIPILHSYPNMVEPIDIEVHKMGDGNGKVLLLMGGIQGDEPGGFNAVDTLISRYKIRNGSVWAVPVLNMHSMLLNHRGIYGDMNRKFANVSESDAEAAIVGKIKNLVRSKEVDLILHLHDGSGFWRPVYMSKKLNPNRWGNCSIIDQDRINVPELGDLRQIANTVVTHINSNLLDEKHRYHINNTMTEDGNEEMMKALTYFAIKNNKPAVANEASKELSLEERVYYHLLAIESILSALGIEYSRDFKLTPSGVYGVISDAKALVHIEDIISLPTRGLKSSLTYFPMPKDTSPGKVKVNSIYKTVGILKVSGYNKESFVVKHGNKLITRLQPMYINFDRSVKDVSAKVDGKERQIKIGEIVSVKDSINIRRMDGYRVNVIGYVAPNNKGEPANEIDVDIRKQDMIRNFSIDKKERLYRAEIYRDNMFSGMFLISF